MLKQLEDGKWMIRANQGHSMKHIQIDEIGQPILAPDLGCDYIHGTFYKNLPGIYADGLLAGGVRGLQRRQMIHAIIVPKGLQRGQRPEGLRNGCEVLIYIDMEEAMRNGARFYTTPNGSIVTQGFDGQIPPEYLPKMLPIEVKTGTASRQGGGVVV